jgi:tetratricopeptide (TPR) repeat protein
MNRAIFSPAKIAVLSICAVLFSSHTSQPVTVAAALPNTLQNPAPSATPQKTQKIRNPLNDLLDQAQTAIDRNDFAAAISPLEKFIAEKPDVAYAHFQLAYAYTALKRPEDARAEYQKCVALDPKMAEAQLNLGILLLRSDPAAAVEPLRQAVNLLPSQSRPRFLLGLAQEQSGDLSGAATSFDGAAHLDPKSLDALTHLAKVLLKTSHPDQAEQKFRLALQLDPKSASSLLGLAQILDAQENPEAIQAYKNYLAVQPQDNAARSRLVHLLIDQKDFDSALAEIDRTTAGQSPTADSLRLKADILVGQKKLDEAIATIQQAIMLAPNDPDLHGGLGRLFLQKRDFPNAQKQLKAALQLNPKAAVYWKDLASTDYLAGNYPEALACLDAAAKLETPLAGSWFLRALCYDKLVQVQPALDAYRKFLELDKNQNPDQVWQATQRIHVLEKTAEKKK